MAAVMCMGDTKHRPSTTPLRATMASTCGVRCTISYRFLVVRVRYSVWAFIPAIAPHFRLWFTAGRLQTPTLYTYRMCAAARTSANDLRGVGVADDEFPDWKVPSKRSHAAQIGRASCKER